VDVSRGSTHLALTLALLVFYSAFYRVRLDIITGLAAQHTL
jgi:hypothetical protein